MQGGIALEWLVALVTPGGPLPWPGPRAPPPGPVTCFQSALSSQWWASVSDPLPLLRPRTKRT